MNSEPSRARFLSPAADRTGAADAEREYLEGLIRADYERCHPGETLEDLIARARFSKEDKGLLREWMNEAARRAKTRDTRQSPASMSIAA